MSAIAKTVWTIGHSTHSITEFIAMLKSNEINVIADIRRFPMSRRLPHFNKDALQQSLKESNIDYIHFEGLGGRRSPVKNSHNTGWRNSSFRGYADFMETPEFAESISQLMEIAGRQRLAYMCSESVWWSCHRSLVSDYLKARGWTVLHIMGESKVTEHPWTSPARIVNGQLTYESENELKF